MGKLLFWVVLLLSLTMAPSLRKLQRSRTDSLFDKDIESIGILPSICEALNKYELFSCFEIWFNSSTFPTYGNWKSIVKNKVRDLERRLWLEFCSGHPNMHVAQACLENVSPSKFWSLAGLYPDLVSRLHTQVRLWVIYVLMVAFHGSLKLRALFVLYAKKTQKRYITTLLSVPF